MDEQLVRMALIFGPEAMDTLAASRVAIFGVGGVGGYVVEALARCGLGALDVVDHDQVSLSNLNRQILATHSTLGMPKVEAAKARILDINPRCRVHTHQTFFLPDSADTLDFAQFDYVVDCIDTVTGKKEILLRAKAAGVPVISAMGAGNKIDAGAFQVSDIYKTSGCPLARVMRKLCRENGIERLKVVYSQEAPIRPLDIPGCQPDPERRSLPGSAVFAVAAAGMLLAGEVVKDLTGFQRGDR